MMQDIHVKLDPGLPWQKQRSTRRDQQTGLKFKVEATEMLQLEHSFVWCWNVDVRKVVQKYLKNM
jgi:hypothetical protein